MTTRLYPAQCLSAFCGRIDCTNCRHKPELDEFKKWVEETGAKVVDPVWCPTVYTTEVKSDGHQVHGGSSPSQPG